ncbi:MAG: hypothetical protein QGH76_06930 [Phycisphaerales bacterium]|jgi:hypothetical protein|nr:hypothetical protein [Phycisphaerales bacterium]
MAHAYTPGLLVTPRISHSVERRLPIAGTVLVEKGDAVQADDIVAETFMPGDIFPMNMANMLAMPPKDVVECMKKKEGDVIAVGDVIAETKGLFGVMFRRIVHSKYAGTIETISPVTGQLIIRGSDIPVQVRAYVSGTVTDVMPEHGCVVEAEVCFVQGIFGIGGETCGPIKIACSEHDQPLTPDLLTEDMKGCVVVGGGRMTDTAIEKAVSIGIAALMSGGIDDQDLREFLGYDLGVAITGSEQKGITLVVTEGFGDIGMARRSYELLCQHEGSEASVNGATQIRAGVMRPEILIPLSDKELQSAESDGHRQAGLLEIGRSVRVIRDPWFGVIGEVAGLPNEPTVLGSGSKARVLKVALESGERVIVPRANVELIED